MWFIKMVTAGTLFVVTRVTSNAISTAFSPLAEAAGLYLQGRLEEMKAAKEKEAEDEGE